MDLNMFYLLLIAYYTFVYTPLLSHWEKKPRSLSEEIAECEWVLSEQHKTHCSKINQINCLSSCNQYLQPNLSS